MTQSEARCDALGDKFSGDRYYVTIKVIMIDVSKT